MKKKLRPQADASVTTCHVGAGAPPAQARFARQFVSLATLSSRARHDLERSGKSCAVEGPCVALCALRGFSLRSLRLNAFDFSYLLLVRISCLEHFHFAQMRPNN